MTKSFRLAVVLLLVLVVASAITPAVRAQGPVNLTLEGWASSESENKLLQQIIDGFNKANDGKIQVKLNQVPDYDTTLAKDLAGGNPPDVFYVDSYRFYDMLKAGALLPIGDKLDKTDDFYPALKDAFTSDGKFYCPPKDFSTLALEVNTTMLDKAGVKPPTTWDELSAAAKALTSGDVVGIIFPDDFARWIALLYQAGGSVTDDKFTKMTINSPEALAAMKFYADLHDKGYAKTAKEVGAGWPGEAFEKGKAAMVFEGNWIIPDLKDKSPDLKYKVVELPAGPKGKATMAFTVCYGVAAVGKNTDAAITLVNYLTGAEGMKAWTDLGLAMPTRQSLRDDWVKKFPDLQAFLAGADYAHKWQFVPGFGAVGDKVAADIDEIFAGTMTPEDALKDIEKIGNQVLEKAAAK